MAGSTRAALRIFMKAIIYARVSSKEQEETGYSLPAQEKFLKEYAEKRQFKITRVFSVSESASGKKQREVFDEMMCYVTKQNIKIVICEKVDRLTRNFKDAVSIDEWLEKDEERQIHLVKDSIILRKDSRSQEKLNWGIRILFAKNHIDNLSEEVKKGQKEKVEQGWLPTKPPLGYKTTGEQGHKTHIIDEEAAPFITRMFELYSTGNYSLKALVEIINKEGMRMREGGKIVKSRMHKLLSDPFYYGKFLWKGEIYDGKHKPIISKELFDLVQIKLNRKTTNPQYKKHLPIFKAMIKCEKCGGTITWYIKKGHWYGQHNNYNDCSLRSNGCIRQEKVEEQLFTYFDSIAPKNERIIKWLEKALKESHKDKIEYHNTERNKLTQEVARIDNRLERLYEDKLDGKINLDFYGRKFKEWTIEKQVLLDELSKLGDANTKYYEAGFAIHELALKAKDIYLSSKATVEEKRLLLSYVFSGMSLKDGRVTPNYTLAFDFLANWMPKLNNILEPKQNTTKSGVLNGIAVTIPAITSNISLESLQPLNNFRTCKNPPLKARFSHSTSESRLLLRG